MRSLSLLVTNDILIPLYLELNDIVLYTICIYIYKCICIYQSTYIINYNSCKLAPPFYFENVETNVTSSLILKACYFFHIPNMEISYKNSSTFTHLKTKHFSMEILWTHLPSSCYALPTVEKP